MDYLTDYLRRMLYEDVQLVIEIWPISEGSGYIIEAKLRLSDYLQASGEGQSVEQALADLTQSLETRKL